MSEIAAKPRRRFLRFSPWALLLLVLAVAVTLAVTINAARRQGIAVTALERAGCYIGFANQQPITLMERVRELIGEINFRNAILASAPSERKSAPAQIGEVPPATLTDTEMVHVSSLTRLETLNLNETQVTDAGLERLGRMSRLINLSLAQTKVTDAGLARLQGLTQLELLDINGTQITDAGLVHLGGLTQLTVLNLAGTQITDAGLARLQGLPKLIILSLGHARVTPAAVQAFKKALPHCRVL